MERKKKIKVYIAGPMRGKKDFNREEFDKADKSLSGAGIYKTFNPSKYDEQSGMTDEELMSKEGLRIVMRRDLDDVLNCDALYMLHGWEKSEGARVEHALGTMLGMHMMYQ